MTARRSGLRVVRDVVSFLYAMLIFGLCLCVLIDGLGIDMTIEYASKKFDEELVQMACLALDFEFNGRSQSYKGPLPSLA